MTSSKTKKIDKTASMSLFVNFCAVFALIYTVGLLLLANIAGGSRGALASISSSVQNKCACASVPAAAQGAMAATGELFPSSSEGELNSAAVSVVMDDAGYAQTELNISISGLKMLEIENKGVNPHSFVIDGLMIDSGAIASGEVRTVVLENLPAIATNYTYYSNVAGDDKETFSGVIIVGE